MTQPQALEGYGCSCGFKAPDLSAYRAHSIRENNPKRGNPKGSHKSIGRINMATGEVIMPPFVERTEEQKLASRYAVGKEKLKTEKQTEKTPEKPSEKPKEGVRITEGARITDMSGLASQIKFIPRVITIDYSPELRAAQYASDVLWSWNLPLQDFIDTVVVRYFRSLGVHLATFTIDESDEEREARLRNLAQIKQKQKEKEVVDVSQT